MYLVEIVLLSLIFPLITVLWFLRYRRIKLQGTEILVLQEANRGEAVQLAGRFEVPVKSKWYRVKLTFNRRVSSAEVYRQFAGDRHAYAFSLENKSGETVFFEEDFATRFFCCCWYPWKGKRKKPLDSYCDAVLLEFLPAEAGGHLLNFRLKTREKGSEIKDVSLRINEDIRPMAKHPCVHACIDLKKKPAEKEAGEKNKTEKTEEEPHSDTDRTEK